MTDMENDNYSFGHEVEVFLKSAGLENATVQEKQKAIANYLDSTQEQAKILKGIGNQNKE